MRCENCRDPGHKPRAIEICADCAPLYHAREGLADAAADYTLMRRYWIDDGCPLDGSSLLAMQHAENHLLALAVEYGAKVRP